MLACSCKRVYVRMCVIISVCNNSKVRKIQMSLISNEADSTEGVPRYIRYLKDIHRNIVKTKREKEIWEIEHSSVFQV